MLGSAVVLRIPLLHPQSEHVPRPLAVWHMQRLLPSSEAHGEGNSRSGGGALLHGCRNGDLSKLQDRVQVLNGKTFLYSIRADDPKAVEYKPNKVPLVLLHEMGGGVGCWARNIKDFAEHRPTYAIDLLGFGRSGRYDTAPCATLTELDYVLALEEWRESMGIEQMILLGHQFGAFIASSYSLEHPSKVRHLVLVEPWGFQEEPHSDENLLQDFPVWMRGIAMLTSLMLPLFFVRLLGPLGIAPRVFRMFNASHMRNFAPWRPKAFSNYFYQCNAQDPSGERSFVTMSHFCWPRRPMIHRFGNVDPNMPVTLIFGTRSNFDRELPKELQDKRPESFTCVQEIWCGSRPHSEAPDEFNNDVLCVCDRVDTNKDLLFLDNTHEYDEHGHEGHSHDFYGHSHDYQGYEGHGHKYDSHDDDKYEDHSDVDHRHESHYNDSPEANSVEGHEGQEEGGPVQQDFSGEAREEENQVPEAYNHDDELPEAESHEGESQKDPKNP
uniref:AB hydrolase-1 domain-containing protein n=1 Tax=Steinernema glaseri TaxID=37863 RepID=A0A1I7Z3K9_9BILA